MVQPEAGQAVEHGLDRALRPQLVEQGIGVVDPPAPMAVLRT
jgi:hypothetical protein